MLYFDIGANIGNWSLNNLNDNKIIAVEPIQSTFEILKSNCSSSPNIICLNYAVCDNNGNDITFYHAYEANTLSTLNLEWLTHTKSRFYNTSYKTITCPTITIDSLINTYGVPDLIKIDVEGGEYECIKSLTQKANILCFEWATELNDISFKCLDYLFSLGYSKFYVQFEDEHTFRPNENDYNDLDFLKKEILKTKPKEGWGMIWCK